MTEETKLEETEASPATEPEPEPEPEPDIVSGIKQPAPDAAVAVNAGDLHALLAEVDQTLRKLGAKGAELAAARARIQP